MKENKMRISYHLTSVYSIHSQEALEFRWKFWWEVSQELQKWKILIAFFFFFFFLLLLLGILFHKLNELSFTFLTHFSFIIPIQQKKHNFPLTPPILIIFSPLLEYNIPFYLEGENNQGYVYSLRSCNERPLKSWNVCISSWEQIVTKTKAPTFSVSVSIWNNQDTPDPS